MSQDLYAKAVINNIPKILTLVDRNPLSPTYGCFDRNFWHYKTIDFASAMYQEYVLPLALVYANEFPGNTFYLQDRIKECVIAGIKFGQKYAHRDGSSDDYFPFERALGAHCFTLYAYTESYQLLKLNDSIILNHFRKMGDWLIKHNETGNLSNHQALAALSLTNVYLLTQDVHYQEESNKRINRVLNWQDEEGWFQEYEGCDPGYHSVTVDFLAKYYEKTKDEKVLLPIKKAIQLMSHFIHPDGSYGGEYGSRNTYNFYPHGLELAGSYSDTATAIADLFLKGLSTGKHACFDDDRIFGHHTFNFLQAYLDFNPDRQGPLIRPEIMDTYLPNANIIIKKNKEYYHIISLAKGGVCKSYSNLKNIYSDTGITAEITIKKRPYIITTNIIQPYTIDSDKITVAGQFCYATTMRPTPFKLIIFRIGLITLGRFAPNIIRKLLQNLLILRRKQTPIYFHRSFDMQNGLEITDHIRIDKHAGKIKFNKLYVGTDQTSIYVATSNTFQESALSPWIDLSHYIHELNTQGYITIKRKII